MQTRGHAAHHAAIKFETKVTGRLQLVLVQTTILTPQLSAVAPVARARAASRGLSALQAIDGSRARRLRVRAEAGVKWEDGRTRDGDVA